MTTGERIRQLRIEKDMTQEMLGEKIGVKKAAIYKYENGLVVNLKRDIIEKLANVLEVSPSYLMGLDDIKDVPQGFQPVPSMKKIPRVGRIACGTPILAEENVEEYDSVPEHWKADFTLVCVGDSMAPKIQDGDLVAIKQQETVENGQIAAVLIDNEATLKRVYVYPDKLILRPENPNYEPIVIMNGESSNIRIEGRAVGFCRGL
ncbi:LexA family protein [Negativibacillus massiliensis]|uniref:LexA family protein n=1 Tax=Negativibacillus massiliensis TaxID=1871035 RepID=UPI003AF947EE